MKCNIDITGEAFRAVDFCEAVLLFEPTRKLAPLLSFSIWGATICTTAPNYNHPFRPPVAFDTGKDSVYISGYSLISFEGLNEGSIDVTLYDPSANPSNFFKTDKGTNIVLNRKWVADARKKLPEYGFDSVLAWPYGYCDLTLFASGKVFLQFDLEDCIPALNYAIKPEVYGWKRGTGSRIPPA